MDSNDNNIEKQMSLIENIFNYIESITNNKIDVDDESSMESLYSIIIEYYNERIDYDSNYFDPYAYVNDMNENILEDEEIDTIQLLIHFNNYLSKLMDGDITEYESIESVYKMIKFYYNDRIIPDSKYFDSYAFKNDLNEVIVELDISDVSDSEESELSESDLETNEKEEILVDPYLEKFINNSQNDDILLYGKKKEYVNNLEKFLNINKIY
tara:strand:+ start:1748 stop:2383 length:636 start_codon:yes stop_codon:yes gene_type:complete